MNMEEAVSRYETLQDNEKVALLGRVAFDFTIEFRDVSNSASSDAERFEKFKGINELQHTLLGQMLAHQSRTTARYGDRDFFLMVVRKAKGNALLPRLQQSMLKQLETPVVR
jgi:hypothetical protein